MEKNDQKIERYLLLCLNFPVSRLYVYMNRWKLFNVTNFFIYN